MMSPDVNRLLAKRKTVHCYLNLCLTNCTEYCGSGHYLFVACKSKGCQLHRIFLKTNFTTPNGLHSLDSSLYSFNMQMALPLRMTNKRANKELSVIDWSLPLSLLTRSNLL